MPKERLSAPLSQQIVAESTHTDRACSDSMVIRRRNRSSPVSVWHPNFARDIHRILYSPNYNHYTDKTQVFP